MAKESAITLRVEKPLKDHAAKQAAKMGVTTGEYVRRLIIADVRKAK